MTRRPARLGTAALLIAATAVFTAGCAATPEPEPTQDASAAPSQVEPNPEPTAEPTSDAVADPTCDTLIPAATVADFESVGWTSISEAFRVGSVELSEGIQCVWGDFTTASDQLQMFGWAPISATEARSVQDELVSGGWRREDAPEGVYITEPTETTIATDDEGYGLTYLFGDGWVMFADTKQSLLLIERPQT